MVDVSTIGSTLKRREIFHANQRQCNVGCAALRIPNSAMQAAFTNLNGIIDVREGRGQIVPSRPEPFLSQRDATPLQLIVV